MEKKFVFKKQLGQHFLIDHNVLANILHHCDNLKTLNVIEVGPGQGTLTKTLLPYCNRLVAVETDKSLIPYLNNIKERYPNFQFMINDAKKINYLAVVNNPKVIISNLPYNIGTYLFTNWLTISSEFQYFILMFQKEVALRITANVNEAHYGRLSLFTKLYGEAELLFEVSKHSFNPVPAVDSAVIKFTPYQDTLNIDKIIFTDLVKNAFATRRKTIRVSLKKYNIDFKQLNIDPQLRPENITFEQFIVLSNYVKTVNSL